MDVCDANSVSSNVDGEDGECVEQMDVNTNRWTRSPPLSVRMSFGEKPHDFVLLQRRLSR